MSLATALLSIRQSVPSAARSCCGVLSFACFIAGCWSQVGVAAELRVVFETKRPPFVFVQNGEVIGIEVDVIRAALQRSGHSLKVLSEVSNSRLLSMLERKQVELSASVQGKDGDGIYYSDPYVEYVNYAISKKSKNITLNTLSELRNYNFIIWANGWRNLGPEFKQWYQPSHQNGVAEFKGNYHEAPDQEAQSILFWKDSVDVIVVDRAVFEWSRKKLSSKLDTSAEVVFHDIFPKRTSYSVAFHNKQLRNQFNSALQQMRQDGTYQAILHKYQL